MHLGISIVDTRRNQGSLTHSPREDSPQAMRRLKIPHAAEPKGPGCFKLNVMLHEGHEIQVAVTSEGLEGLSKTDQKALGTPSSNDVGFSLCTTAH